MSRFLRNILLATLPGLMVAAASFHFFTREPQNPAEDITIDLQQQTVPVGIFGMFARSLASSAKPEDVVTKFYDYFDNFKNTTIMTYTIRNNGGREVRGISIKLAEMKVAYFDDDINPRPIFERGEDLVFSLLPNSSATLTVLSVGYRAGVSEKFLLNSEGIEVEETANPLYEDPLSAIARTHPFLAMLVLLTAATIIAVALFLWVLRLSLINRPHLWAQAIDSGRLVEDLVAINYLKVENPAKYEDVVNRAVKVHATWRDRQVKGAGDSTG